MKWLADECFNNDIVRALLRRSHGFDIIRAQDVAEIAGNVPGATNTSPSAIVLAAGSRPSMNGYYAHPTENLR